MPTTVGALGPAGAQAARRLRALRRRQDLTLADIAARLERLGRPITVSGLSKIEKGQRRVDVDDLLALAGALNVQVDDILFPQPEAPATAQAPARLVPPTFT